MFPLLRGDGARLMRALGAMSLARNSDAYEEIRPPTFALTETMMSTGHLPKSADDMYGIERDGLWAIPTAEVPLTSMHRGEILDEPIACRSADRARPRASGARPARPGATRAGCCACTSSTRASSSPTAPRRPPGRLRRHPGARRGDAARARAGLPAARPVLRGPGHLERAHDRPRGLQPGRRPVARGLLGQLVPRLPGAPRQRPLPHAPTAAPRWCTRSTARCSAGLAAWAAIVETYRQRRRVGRAARRAGAATWAGGPAWAPSAFEPRSGSRRRAPS